MCVFQHATVRTRRFLDITEHLSWKAVKEACATRCKQDRGVEIGNRYDMKVQNSNSSLLYVTPAKTMGQLILLYMISTALEFKILPELKLVLANRGRLYFSFVCFL